MRLPFASPQTYNSSNPKQQGNNLTGGRNTRNNHVYNEPKSVLDIRRSSSPIATAGKTELASDIVLSQPQQDNLVVDPLHLDDDDHGSMINQFEEWDSLMRELGLHDDSIPPTKSIHLQSDGNNNILISNHYQLDLPDLPPIHSSDSVGFLHSDSENLNPVDLINHWDGGCDFVDELIRIAECFETQSLQLAHVILARLNQRLRSPAGKPLQRAAFYFKEALQSLLTGSTRLTRPSTPSEIVQAIKAYKTFANVSPIPMFSHLTANQSILEAVDGAMIVHIIDFDIGIGGHWASFMEDLADKAHSRKANTPALKLTAVVPEEYETESQLIRENLCQFARDLKLRFEVDFVSLRTFEFLSFKSIKFMEGEKTAVLLSPKIFRRIGTGFVNDLRRVSPHVVVQVDGEGLVGGGTSFFRQTVIDGLELYSTIMESLEAANVGGGGGGDWIRKVEMFVLLPKIIAAVEAAGRHATPWREAFSRAGFRPVGPSQFADFQAECLLRRVQVRGFHVVRRQAEMMLCWHDRPLVATSAWRC